jgi:hypothetical protein
MNEDTVPMGRQPGDYRSNAKRVLERCPGQTPGRRSEGFDHVATASVAHAPVALCRDLPPRSLEVNYGKTNLATPVLGAISLTFAAHPE